MSFEVVQCVMMVLFLAIWILVGQVLVHAHPREDRSLSGWETERRHSQPARPHFSSVSSRVKMGKQLRS